METLWIGMITVPDEDTARRLARTLVEERLAACVNVVPEIRSVYRWQGAVREDGEWLLVVKTQAAAAEEIARRLTEWHPYEVPEWVAWPIGAGHMPYVAWALEACRTEAQKA